MHALNLKKEKSLVLTKEDGNSLTKITLGLGWSVAKKRLNEDNSFFGFINKAIDCFFEDDDIDLDSSVLVFGENKKLIENVYYGNLRGDGIKHLGDDRTGRDKKTATDNEQIEIDLSKVNPNAKYLAFTINSFSGETFKEVDSSYCRVLDGDKEVVRIELAEKGKYTAVVLAIVIKGDDGKWTIKNVSKTANARTAIDLVPIIKNIL